MSNTTQVAEVIKKGLLNNVDTQVDSLMEDAQRWAEWKNAHPQYTGDPTRYPNQVYGTKDYQIQVHEMVHNLAPRADQLRNKNPQFVLRDNAEDLARRWSSKQVELSVDSAVNKLEVTFEKKFGVGLGDVNIIEFRLGHATGDPIGVFEIDGDLYDSQSILAWGPKRRPHYRFLLKKSKAKKGTMPRPKVSKVLHVASMRLLEAHTALPTDIKEDLDYLRAPIEVRSATALLLNPDRHVAMDLTKARDVVEKFLSSVPAKEKLLATALVTLLTVPGCSTGMDMPSQPQNLQSWEQQKAQHRTPFQKAIDNAVSYGRTTEMQKGTQQAFKANKVVPGQSWEVVSQSPAGTIMIKDAGDLGAVLVSAVSKGKAVLSYGSEQFEVTVK